MGKESKEKQKKERRSKKSKREKYAKGKRKGKAKMKGKKIKRKLTQMRNARMFLLLRILSYQFQLNI